MPSKKFARKDKIVLDTNILVSGLLNPSGVPNRILQYLILGAYELLISEAIYQEYAQTLGQFIKIHSTVRTQLLDKIKHYASWHSPKERLDIIQADPADNKFLECAVEGNARYIISGDKHLLRLQKFQRIEIIKPAEYLTILDSLILK